MSLDLAERANVRFVATYANIIVDPPYYFTRHGCVGCLLVTMHRMQAEYKLFPDYAWQMIRSIGEYMDSKPDNAIA